MLARPRRTEFPISDAERNQILQVIARSTAPVAAFEVRMVPKTAQAK